RLPDRVHATPSRVVGDLVPEDVQGTADEPGGPVRVVAGAPALHQPRPADHVRNRARVGAGTGYLLHCGGDAGQAVEAWPALPGRLQRQVTGDPRGLRDPAAASWQAYQDPGPHERAGGLETLVAERHPGRIRDGQPGTV